MIESTQNIIAGIYTRLRRPSQSQLPYLDAQEQVSDIARELVQEQNLSSRENRTVVAPVTPEQQDNQDYLIRVPGAVDYEPMKLEINPQNSGWWYELEIAPLHGWAQAFSLPGLSASFYGTMQVEDGQMCKLNIAPDAVTSASFRLTYRLPLLTVLQLGDAPPVPAAFVPMIKDIGAVRCMPLVRDDTDRWTAWMERMLPIYEANVTRSLELWREYLRTTQLPPVVDMPRFDAHRGAGRMLSRRGYVPRQA